MALVKRHKSAQKDAPSASIASSSTGRYQPKSSTSPIKSSSHNNSTAPNIAHNHNNSNNNSHHHHHQQSKPSPFKQMLNMKKSHIYNLEHRKKPDELRRKDLISAMKLPDHDVLNRKDYLKILDPWKQDWERGVQVPVDVATLPRTNLRPFNQDSPSNKRTVSCDVSISSTKQHDIFHQPDNRIDYETSADVFIGKYELDLQDISWLSAVRDSDLSIKISDFLMEDVINELEQECARNMKDKQVGIEFFEDTVCDVCQGGEVEDGNEIVFCELCNIGVHQACYGIETIPDDDWLCNVCRTIDANPKKKPSCVLCPKSGGALKPTTRKSNQWAHVSCAYWIPEVKFVNYNLLEPIDIKPIRSSRWNLTCSLCNIKKGACILCDEKYCRAAYHVTCAIKHRLKMKLITQGDTNLRFRSYCLKHSEETSRSSDNVLDIFQPNNSNNNNNEAGTSKSNNKSGTNIQNSPNHEFWKHIDLKKLNETITKQYALMPDLLESSSNNPEMLEYDETNLKQVIEMIYQYWKLKRICNSGNSLIKLTLAQKFEEHMNSTYHRMKSFRFHMERLRTIAYMIYKRDQAKERWHKAQKECLENVCKAFLTNDNSNDSQDNTPNDTSTMEWKSEIYHEDQKLCKQIIPHHRVYGEESIDKKKEKNVTKYLLRQLKKLAEVDRIYMSANKSSSGNPYARTYRHSLLARTNSEQKILDSASRKRIKREDEDNDDQQQLQSSVKKKLKRNKVEDDDDEQSSHKLKKIKKNLSLEFEATDNEEQQQRIYNFRHSPPQDEQHSNDSDSHQKENSAKIHKNKCETDISMTNSGPKRSTKLVKNNDHEHNVTSHHHHHHRHHHNHHNEQQQQQQQRRKPVQSNDNLTEAPLVLKSNNSFEKLRGGLRSLRDRVSMAFKRS